jgi:hypothetical protein
VTVEVAVDSIRCEAWAGGQTCLRRPGRMVEAIVSLDCAESGRGRAAMQCRNVNRC